MPVIHLINSKILILIFKKYYATDHISCNPNSHSYLVVFNILFLLNYIH